MPEEAMPEEPDDMDLEVATKLKDGKSFGERLQELEEQVADMNTSIMLIKANLNMINEETKRVFEQVKNTFSCLYFDDPPRL